MYTIFGLLAPFCKGAKRPKKQSNSIQNSVAASVEFMNNLSLSVLINEY